MWFAFSNLAQSDPRRSFCMFRIRVSILARLFSKLGALEGRLVDPGLFLENDPTNWNKKHTCRIQAGVANGLCRNSAHKMLFGMHLLGSILIFSHRLRIQAYWGQFLSDLLWAQLPLLQCEWSFIGLLRRLICAMPSMHTNIVSSHALCLNNFESVTVHLLRVNM